jgi:predicted transcriptional regulator of viral defense system
MAAVLACGPGAVLSHRDAAHLHEIRATNRSKIDVMVPGRGRHRHGGINVHRSTTLTTADVTTIDGIPCTTLARTILDLAGVVAQRDLERALEQAEMLQKLDARALEDQLERNRTPTRPAGAPSATRSRPTAAGTTAPAAASRPIITRTNG